MAASRVCRMSRQSPTPSLTATAHARCPLRPVVRTKSCYRQPQATKSTAMSWCVATNVMVCSYQDQYVPCVCPCGGTLLGLPRPILLPFESFMLPWQVDKGRVSSGSVSIRLVLRPNNDSREVELLPDHKVSPDDGLYKCSVECSHAGMVAVVFSNTSSVWSRTIHYNADIGMEAQE
eukprot:357274-Chlamydomonas_euryale.AAC.6